MGKNGANAQGFTYTKLRSKALPAVVSAAACASLLPLASLTNQHEWAVHWLRRYEAYEPPLFCVWVALEAAVVYLGIDAVGALIQRVRQSRSTSEEKIDPSKRPSLGDRIIEKMFSVYSLRTVSGFFFMFLFQAVSIALMKRFGAGFGTQAAASACVCALFSCLRRSRSRGLEAVRCGVCGVYTGFAFAHWSAASWTTAFWTMAGVYALLFVSLVSILMLATCFESFALKHWIWLLAFGGAIAAWAAFGGSLEWTVGWLQRRYEKHDPWAFCWRIALEQLLVAVVLILPQEIYLHYIRRRWRRSKAATEPERETEEKIVKEEQPSEDAPSQELLEHPFLFDSFTTLFSAPFGETLLFQAVVILTLNALGADIGTQAMASAVWFALVHFTMGFGKGVGAGVPGGVYLGFTFAYWLQDSLWTALWATTAAHSMVNSFPGLLSAVIEIVWRLKARREKKAAD